MTSGQESESVIAVDKNGKVYPLGVYSNGSISFETSSTGAYVIIYNRKSFTDVSGHWAINNINFVTARGLYEGIGNNQFAPNMSMTRAMFAKVLANLEGIDLSAYEGSYFTDVAIDAWYAATVEWAADKGIIGGYGNGKFGPNDEITREQMAVMMYNYMKYKGYTVLGDTSMEFVDEQNISAWAFDAVKAIQSIGIVSGKPGNVYDPKGIATRGEVATIFARLVEYLGGTLGKAPPIAMVTGGDKVYYIEDRKTFAMIFEYKSEPKDVKKK